MVNYNLTCESVEIYVFMFSSPFYVACVASGIFIFNPTTTLKSVFKKCVVVALGLYIKASKLRNQGLVLFPGLHFAFLISYRSYFNGGSFHAL